MRFTDIDVQIARQRYEDELRHARLLRLIRAANGQAQAAEPARPRSLLARVWSALLERYAAPLEETADQPALRRDTALR